MSSSILRVMALTDSPRYSCCLVRRLRTSSNLSGESDVDSGSTIVKSNESTKLVRDSCSSAGFEGQGPPRKEEKDRERITTMRKKERNCSYSFASYLHIFIMPIATCNYPYLQEYLHNGI